MVIDEDFFQLKSIGFGLDRSLPIRLQKRQLLDMLGFPKNDRLKSCSSNDRQSQDSLFEEYCLDSFPFLIIVSEKPSFTIIPPLFIVKEPDKIVWRSDKGNKKDISHSEMIEVISQLGPASWLEFSPYIWGPEILAGRLTYIDPQHQIIELQKGVIPSQLIASQGGSLFSGSIEYLDIGIHDYRGTSRDLAGIGHQNILDFYTVKAVVDFLAGYPLAFERLARISRLPTLEFGYLKNKTFVPIDVDWPSQWKRDYIF